jgi:hypothetical protein
VCRRASRRYRPKSIGTASTAAAPNPGYTPDTDRQSVACSLGSCSYTTKFDSQLTTLGFHHESSQINVYTHKQPCVSKNITSLSILIKAIVVSDFRTRITNNEMQGCYWRRPTMRNDDRHCRRSRRRRRSARLACALLAMATNSATREPSSVILNAVEPQTYVWQMSADVDVFTVRVARASEFRHGVVLIGSRCCCCCCCVAGSFGA